MKKFLFPMILFMFLQITNAAPGLTVDGTEFKYKGKKIFFSGMNLAWIDYNSDVGAEPLDENAWRKAVEDIRAAGGNAIRWWLFNNMGKSPTVNTTTNLVSGLPVNTIANMKKALDIAEEYGVMVSMCLFSHNLMEADQWGLYNKKVPYDANRKLFTDEGIEAFINNALLPVLEGVGNHNALWTWELFNEPEGMIAGWAGDDRKMDLASIRKFSNRVASAIHEHDATLLVSTGVNNASKITDWNDANLRAAGGKQNGTLDFYQVHFYPEHLTTEENPFDNTFAVWNTKWSLNKPLVIGEFWAAGWNKEEYPAFKVATKTPVELYMHAYEAGYSGAMAWNYPGDQDAIIKQKIHNYAAAKPGMEALAAEYEEFIKIKDYTPVSTDGNGVMQVTYEDVGTEATLEYTNPTPNLTGNSTVSFKVRKVGDSPSFSLRLAVKSRGDWTWSASEKMCNIPNGEEWTTCTYDLTTDFEVEVGLSNVQSFLIQTSSNGYSGVIQVDDFKAGDIVINDFDTRYDVFSIAGGMDGSETITEIKTVYLKDSTPIKPTLKVNLSTIDFSKASVYNINGKRIFAKNISELKNGVYVIKIGKASKRFVVNNR